MKLLDLTPVALSLIAVFAGLVTYRLIPVIKQKLSKEERENLYGWAVIAVKAAEQAMKSGKIDKEQRKVEALNFLRKKGFDIDLAEVEAAIEAAVRDLPKTFTE